MSSEVGSVPEQAMQHHGQLGGQSDTRLSGTGTSCDRQRPTLQIETLTGRVRMTLAAS